MPGISPVPREEWYAGSPQTPPAMPATLASLQRGHIYCVNGVWWVFKWHNWMGDRVMHKPGFWGLMDMQVWGSDPPVADMIHVRAATDKETNRK
jgi:hypothetical protein